MLPTAHILAPMVGLLLYGRWQDRTISDRFLTAIGVFGILPDLLNPHLTLAGRVSWSHSLLILIPIGIGVLVTSDRTRQYFTLLFGGFSTHILLDVISAPYNFLYPLEFSYGIDIYPEVGAWFVSWYAIDLLLLTAFVVLMTIYREPS